MKKNITVRPFVALLIVGWWLLQQVQATPAREEEALGSFTDPADTNEDATTSTSESNVVGVHCSKTHFCENGRLRPVLLIMLLMAAIWWTCGMVVMGGWLIWNSTAERQSYLSGLPSHGNNDGDTVNCSDDDADDNDSITSLDDHDKIKEYPDRSSTAGINHEEAVSSSSPSSSSSTREIQQEEDGQV